MATSFGDETDEPHPAARSVDSTFDGRPERDVTLDTRWRILGRDGDELAFRRSTIIEAATGSGYGPIVAAMARALGTLGREIAAEIRTLPEGSRR